MKTILCLLAIALTSHCFAQKDKAVSLYVSADVSRTLYDRTQSNNAVGFGAGLLLYVRTKTWVRPVLDASSHVYGGTKELRVTADGKPIYAKDEVHNIYAGAYFQWAPRWFASFTAGPSFFNSHAYLGIKPGVGYFLLKGRQLAVRAAFTNVFQHDEQSKETFGFYTVSFVVKVF
jgi:hypothetical protein